MHEIAPRQPVSIITVLYGGYDTLVRTLPTWAVTLSQVPTELIVVDNTPGDDVENLLSETLGELVSHLVHNTRNVGFAAAANQGATLASGRLLFFLNADVFLTPEALTEIQSSTTKVQSAALRLDTGKRSSVGIELTSYGFLSDRPTDSSRTCLGPSGGAGLIDRQLFMDLGGFYPEYFAWGEDSALALRLSQAGVATATVPIAMEHVGGHTVTSLSGQRLKARLLARNRIWTYRGVFLRRQKLRFFVPFVCALMFNSLRKARSRTLGAYLLGVWQGISIRPPLRKSVSLSSVADNLRCISSEGGKCDCRTKSTGCGCGELEV